MSISNDILRGERSLKPPSTRSRLILVRLPSFLHHHLALTASSGPEPHAIAGTGAPPLCWGMWALGSHHHNDDQKQDHSCCRPSPSLFWRDVGNLDTLDGGSEEGGRPQALVVGYETQATTFVVVCIRHPSGDTAMRRGEKQQQRRANLEGKITMTMMGKATKIRAFWRTQLAVSVWLTLTSYTRDAQRCRALSGPYHFYHKIQSSACTTFLSLPGFFMKWDIQAS